LIHEAKNWEEIKKSFFLMFTEEWNTQKKLEFDFEVNQPK
jgi:hypothetical protein